MPKTHPSIAVQNKWANAIAMASHSLVKQGEVTNIVPKNFSNGKNAAPRGVQNYDLSLMMLLEGYKTNLWATPRQIAEIGGVIDDNAPRATISVAKTSKAGSQYYSNYKVVNLDEVDFPNGISDEAYDQIVAASEIQETYVVPSPTSFKPDYSGMERKSPKNDYPLFHVEPKYGRAPSAKTTTLPSNVPAPAKRNEKTRETNVMNPRHAHDFTTDGRPANVKLDIDEFNIHIEARTADELQLILERTLKAYVQTKQILASM